MIELSGVSLGIDREVIGVVTRPVQDRTGRLTVQVLVRSGASRIYLTDGNTSPDGGEGAIVDLLGLPQVREGSVVALSPSGTVTVLYTPDARGNSVIVTEACNSACVMCPQVAPARPVSLLERNKEIIRNIPRGTAVLGFTGGEPTVALSELIELLELCKERIPETRVELLTNGVALDDMEIVRAVLAVQHPKLSFHIPVYADVAEVHDVMTGMHSFHRTIEGLLNLARCRQSVEVRNVVTLINYLRLPQWAAFVAANLPFVEHVAIMGLEPVGRARENFDALFVGPAEAVRSIGGAMRRLLRGGIPSSIYGYQLCNLQENLWRHSRKAISDWKNSYLPQCATCDVVSRCGGFFASQLGHGAGYSAEPIRMEI